MNFEKMWIPMMIGKMMKFLFTCFPASIRWPRGRFTSGFLGKLEVRSLLSTTIPKSLIVLRLQVVVDVKCSSFFERVVITIGLWNQVWCRVTKSRRMSTQRRSSTAPEDFSERHARRISKPSQHFILSQWHFFSYLSCSDWWCVCVTILPLSNFYLNSFFYQRNICHTSSWVLVWRRSSDNVTILFKVKVVQKNLKRRRRNLLKKSKWKWLWWRSI